MSEFLKIIQISLFLCLFIKNMVDDDGIIEDLTVSNKPYTIVERKLIYDSAENQWVWSDPQQLNYKKQIDKKRFEVIKTLVSSADLQVSPSSLIHYKSDSESDIKSIISLASNIDFFWQPPKLQLNQTCLIPIMRNKITKWVEAKLIYIGTDGTGDFAKLSDCENITTSLNLVAYCDKIDQLLQVGTRVVVTVRNVSETGEVLKGRKCQKLGIIAEFPTFENQQRYLIISDDGCWHYVKRNNVAPTFYQSLEVWEILEKDVAHIVKEFFKGAFILKTFKNGDSVKHCFKKEKRGVVFKVDCSLILVWFNDLSTSEWIHRGSPYLINLSSN